MSLFMLIQKIHTILSKYGADKELEVALLTALSQHNESLNKTIKTDSAETWCPSDDDTAILDSDSSQDNSSTFNQNPSLNDRYDDLGILGIGAMGEVRKVLDHTLKRTLAMKIIHPKLLAMNNSTARFMEEAQIGAQLQHPNIVPVHDMGKLKDGRFFFTMKQVKGKPLDQAIDEVHQTSHTDLSQVTDSGWSFRRLIDAFYDVCKAVAFAHSKGVLHRDLKPANIMLGEYGEVLVVDWGIAKVLGKIEHDFDTDKTDAVLTARSELGAHATRFGQVAGTPAYMSPEQAKGEIDKLDARTDVYALGSILYEILIGSPAYTGKNGLDILQQVLDGPPKIISVTTHHTLPEELISACEKAMSRNIFERYESATELAQVISDWLDGAKKREQALEIVMEAMSLTDKRKDLEKQSKRLVTEAEQGLQEIPVWEGESTKGKWWEKQRIAEELSEQAQLLNIIQKQKLQAALTHKADLEEAHLELAKKYQNEHRIAEKSRNTQEANKVEIRLKKHAEGLPENHPERIQFLAYLKGTGAVSLTTDTDGVEVTLEKFIPHHRRVIPQEIKKMGTAPFVSYSLEMGSYLLRLQKSGHHDVVYPVSIERGEHWDSVDPLGNRPEIHIPRLGELENNDCYIPGGWFWAGDDKISSGALPRRRVWIDSFIMNKNPVTNREYLRFLDDLMSQGKENKAFQFVPRERAAKAGQLGAMIYGIDDEGKFRLVPDADGHVWNPDWPVMMIDYFCASAYAAWLSEKQSKNWRLPHELEWEKSARGVDERIFVWGDGFDPSYACMRHSHKVDSLPSVVDSFPIDCSLYGVRGLAGNIMDWTNTVFSENWDGIAVDCNKIILERATKSDALRIIRGGGWGLDIKGLEANRRGRYDPYRRSSYLGFRLCRTY
jgi:eukaryotic-like serine/threonine-protein kinase